MYSLLISLPPSSLFIWPRPVHSPLDAILNHVAGHELNAALKVFGELLLRPVQVPDERLQGVQLPEEVLRCPGTVASGDANTHAHVM